MEAIVDILKAVVEGRRYVPLYMKCKSRAKAFLILILRLLPSHSFLLISIFQMLLLCVD